MSIPTLTNIDVRSKRVLMRVDYNVPIDDQGHIIDDTRIKASLPTLKHILDQGGRAILMSHLGRPKGIVESLRLKPVAERLAALLGAHVHYATDSIGEGVEQQVAQLKNGACLLLENIRFYAEETNNDETFARTLAQFGEVYVNDAFGAAHRAHASTEGVTHFIPIRAAGFLMQKELDYLAGAVSDPKRPFVVILGGAKVSDKIAVTQRLIEIADTLIIGGGMAYTFLKSQGRNIGHSLLDEENLSFAAEMINKAKTENKSLLLPIDHVIAEKFDPEDTRITSQVPDGWMGLDIGPETRDQFVEAIEQAGTILWNGPMGVFENAAFSGGTAQVGQAVAQATDHGAVSIIGGGDTAAAVNLLGLKSRMSHISTGGGASLELLEGRDLPGVKALN